MIGRRISIGDDALRHLCLRYKALERNRKLMDRLVRKLVDLNKEQLMTITQLERAARRKAMAAKIAKGGTRAQVAESFGVSDRLVRMACEEHDVEYDVWASGTGLGVVAIVAGLIKARHTSIAKVARSTDNTRQRVHQVLQQCVEYNLVKPNKFGRQK